jgi:hypothetical protein
LRNPGRKRSDQGDKHAHENGEELHLVADWGLE